MSQIAGKFIQDGTVTLAKLASSGASSGSIPIFNGSQWTSVAGIGTASIPFTDGDLTKRVTVSDGQITNSSVILTSIQRPNTSDANDKGYVYSSTVVNVTNGSFDVIITCVDIGFMDTTLNPPNETIKLVYMRG